MGCRWFLFGLVASWGCSDGSGEPVLSGAGDSSGVAETGVATGSDSGAASVSTSGATGESTSSRPDTTSSATTTGGSGDTAPAGCDAPQTLTLSASADTLVLPTGCHMPIAYGAADALQVGTLSENFAPNAGLSLVRFDLSDEESEIVFGPDLLRATVVLQAHVDCVACGPDGIEPQAGELRVHVLRNDWVEGVNSPYGGADYCRRDDQMDGLGWGYPDQPATSSTDIAEGVDYGGVIGSQAYPDGATSVEVEIDGVEVDPFEPSATSALSLLLETSAGILMAASRETGDAGPRLDVEYCP